MRKSIKNPSPKLGGKTLKNRTKNTTNFQVWDPILEPFALGFPGGDCLLTTRFSEPLQGNPGSDFCLPRGTVGAIRQHPESDFAFPLGPVGAIRRPFQVRACRSHLRFFFLPSNTTSPAPHQHITKTLPNNHKNITNALPTPHPNITKRIPINWLIYQTQHHQQCNLFLLI